MDGRLVLAGKLQNLGELVITCRSGAAKDFVEEAIVCYEAGAVRSSIVATWSAVFFDVLEKARELGIGGDAQAQAIFERFERAETNGDIASLLKFESEILEIARNDLELFSAGEFLDLKRVQEDRHRCAHPTLDGAGNRFVPSAELARAHIVNSITILIQQPPVQGKAAIDGIVALVSSKLFPNEVGKAVVALQQTGLARPRASLLRNTAIVFLKKYLKPNGDVRSHNYLIALKALLELHRTDSFKTLEQEFSRILRSIEDSELNNAIHLLWSLRELSYLIEDDQLERLRKFVGTLSGDNLYLVEGALEIEPFKEKALGRISWMTLDEIANTSLFELITPVGDRLIELLESSKSFDESNATCSEIRRHLADFTAEQRGRILSVGNENDQVESAFEYKNICTELETQIGR